MFALGTTAQAVEVSVGASMQIGASALRGDDFNDYENYIKSLDLNGPFSIGFIPSIDLMLEFTPYLALETGLQYQNSVVRYDNIDGYIPVLFPLPNIKGTVLFIENAIAIPLMARFQHEWSRVLLYGSIGPKFFIPITDYVSQNHIDDKIGTLPNIESRSFYMDVAFALGAEFRVGDANYIGIRTSYDLNVISPIKSIGGAEVKSFYNDAWAIGLTYRYAFNSKWKK